MRRSSWVILAGGTAFAGFVFYSLLNVEPVRVISSRLEQSNGRVYVQGEVTNRGRTDSSIQLEVHYFDPNGRALGEDKLNLASLRPGESRDFRSPVHDLHGVKNFTILLTHGRNPYGN